VVVVLANTHQAFTKCPYPCLQNFSRKKTTASLAIALVFCFGLVALAQRPLGIDVSHWQGLTNDWNSVKASGVSFAWCKATEDTGYDDPSYIKNQTNAANVGILLGAYHFARPDQDPGIAGAIAEATHFWNVASNYIKGSNIYFMPMLDMERRGLETNVPAITKATLSQWVNAWCSNVVARAAATGVAVKPVIYTGHLYSTTWMNSTVTNWPAWMANWPASPDPQVDAPNGTGPWSDWAFWQYSATGAVPGVPGDCDLDVFQGTSNSLSSFAVGAPIAPFFITQPLLHRVANSGATVSLVAGVGGTLPLKYQWTSNNVPITGATNSTLTLVNVQTNHAANYALAVSNSVGSIASSAVSLRVFPLQATVFADNFDVNTASNWICSRNSPDTEVNFAFNYGTLGIPSAPNSTGGTTLGVQMKANLANGVAAAVSLSPTNKSFTADYRLRFDAWINVNGPFPAGGAGSTLSLTAGLGATGTNTQWNGSGSTAKGYYFAMNGDGGAGTNAAVPDYCAFSNVTAMAAASGVYAAGTDITARDDENVYYLRAFPNALTAPAQQRTDYPQQGDNALDPGSVGFAWHDVIVSRRGSVVDWSVDGIRLATISNTVVIASNICIGLWDPFTSLSSNNAINFGLIDNVRVEVPAVAPIIAAHPQSQWGIMGSNTTFAVSASGLPAPAYQWKFNSTNIAGATNAVLLLSNLQATNLGLYSVIVTNIAGAQASSNATLSLIASAQPAMQLSGPSAGNVQLDCLGQIGASYALETSTNLVDWTTLTNIVADNAAFSFTPSVSPGDTQRYFRLRSGP